MKIKRIILGGLAMSALVLAAPLSAASAADMPLKAPPAAIWSWTGFYAGVDAGYTWNALGVSIAAVPAFGTATANPNSGTFGGHVGYLYQLNNPFVIGVEGDVSWLNGNNASAFPGGSPNGNWATNKWDASARGIAGFTFNRALVYGTGGASWLNGSTCGVTNIAILTCFANTTVSGTRTGWTVGGGIAYPFTNHLIFRVEYLYANYGPFSAAGLTGYAGAIINVTDTTNTLRAGLSWKFGGP